MVKVSVIIPVYNVEDYITDCLNSLVKQTLKDIEVIVVNDGSPDNSQKIIDEFVKKYPHLFKSYIKENEGQGSARNLGLKEAKGEYISFVDSDDFLVPTALEEMYNLAKQKKADIVICDMRDYFKNGTFQDYNCTKYNSVYEVTGSACNKIFKKKVLNDIKFLNSYWYEDFNFTTKILLTNPKIVTISKPFYCCNSRDVSTMNNNNSLKNLDIIYVIDDLKKYAKSKNLYDENIFSFLIFHHILIAGINRVALQKNKDKKIVIKKLRDYCHEQIPNYKHQPFYQNIARNRKIIARLNYWGLHNISKLLLKIKEKISR